jgi:hypothetical protein
MYNLILKRVCSTIFAVEKQLSIVYSKPEFIASVTQRAKRKSHIVICGVAWLTLQTLSTLSHKRQDFRKKKMLLNTKCVF